MAKLKKTAHKSSARKSTANAGSGKAQAERLGKSITESAQQIWLAGMGAFNRAQAEGGKLFESLVRDGLSRSRPRASSPAPVPISSATRSKARSARPANAPPTPGTSWRRCSRPACSAHWSSWACPAVTTSTR